MRLKRKDVIESDLLYNPSLTYSAEDDVLIDTYKNLLSTAKLRGLAKLNEIVI